MLDYVQVRFNCIDVSTDSLHASQLFILQTEEGGSLINNEVTLDKHIHVIKFHPKGKFFQHIPRTKVFNSFSLLSFSESMLLCGSQPGVKANKASGPKG